MLSTLRTNFLESKVNAYLVGGFIRDRLLGIESKDLDIVLDSRAKIYIAPVLKAFRLNVYFDLSSDFIYKNDFLELSYFARYEILSIKLGTHSFDFVPMRCELFYTNLRSPDKILFTKNLYLDALRRDFSINAIYESLLDSSLLDPFSGLKDLEEKRLTAVGDANLKLQEDALRILRALDFAFRYNLSLDKSLESSLHQNYKLSKSISLFHKKHYLFRYLNSLLASSKKDLYSNTSLSLATSFQKELDFIFGCDFLELVDIVLRGDGLNILEDKKVLKSLGLETSLKLSCKEVTSLIKE
ncbi:CCA tRNA nucleotidyltransferase [Helicobacter sp. 11S02629-2]|uniref:CCA tRNA nucleotidyltransferase n=1 Tax=Helicobacter sp. 11S02629-2 TaxID=1476195 RepID=UPI000BC6E796|nr:CCA tRNA nucleotidyltransferase [Helicobacter sp. 11S02629-2]PAF44076.1 hypothetical protein BKH40_06300 [Helicobacter sp. 11S02629-2]